MGSSSSKPEATTAPEVPASTNGDAPAVASSGGGGCPVKHSHSPAKEGSRGCPMKRRPQQQQQQQQQQYNVYSQPIDPKNQMPAVANQLPSPGQKESLSTERVPSTIPKGGAEKGTTWTYPSPQMFYNALARKGKLGTTDESVVGSVVALHNNMNERTWQKVLEWEQVSSPGQTPKLLKFIGRPSDLSPKARFKHWVLGHPLPFDRHDWTVEREDGTTVRYVIDYYHDESRASEEENSGMPGLRDFEATPSLMVDVRPALDGPNELYDRAFRMPCARHVSHSTPFTPLPLMPTAVMKTQVKESLEVWENIQKAKLVKQEVDDAKIPEITEQQAIDLAKSFGSILKDCRKAQAKVRECESEEDCAKASMDLTLCIGKLLCPLQHKAIVDALQHSSDNEDEYHARVEAALGNVAECVAGENRRASIAKQAFPKAFAINGK